MVGLNWFGRSLAFADFRSEVTFQFARLVETHRQFQATMSCSRPCVAARVAEWEEGLRLRITEADQADPAWMTIDKYYFVAAVTERLLLMGVGELL